MSIPNFTLLKFKIKLYENIILIQIIHDETNQIEVNASYFKNVIEFKLILSANSQV